MEEVEDILVLVRGVEVVEEVKEVEVEQMLVVEEVE